MATPPTFPSLPGVTYSVIKRPVSSTRVTSHISEREVRAALYPSNLYEFELTIMGMDSTGAFPGLGTNSLQSLFSLYLQTLGGFGTFLYTDTTDNSVTGQSLGSGNGTSTSFPFLRSLNGTPEKVSWVTSVSRIYLSGVSQSSGWVLAQPNTLTFTTAPGVGVAITADFSFAFQCRFLEDSVEFENFMQGLWSVSSVKFREVKP